MKQSLFVSVILCFGALFVVGCAPQQEGGDYKEAAEGTYKTSDQVPERGGRTKAEAGGEVQPGMGRTEGG